MKKFLLIQFRNDATQKHEYKCVLKKGGFEKKQLDYLDTFKTPLNLSLIKKYDAIFLGGSGDLNVSSKKYPQAKIIKKFIQQCVKDNKPVMGFCFGFHLIVDAFGGKIVYDLARKEVGTYKIALTKTGRKSKIFKGLPNSFLAQEGHQDVVVKKPKAAVTLAGSKLNRFQAFSWPGTKIYAVQFHPELSKKDAVYRIDYFLKLYKQQAGELKLIKKRTKDTPVAPKIIENYINYVV